MVSLFFLYLTNDHSTMAEWLCSFPWVTFYFWHFKKFVQHQVLSLQFSGYSSDTKDVEPSCMDIFRHVGVLPFLPLFIPSHYYQQCRESEGKSEHGNFHLSFIIIKSQRNSPSGHEILTLLSVAKRAFCMRMVDITLRIPANRDFLKTIFRPQITSSVFQLTLRMQKLPRKRKRWRG